MKKIKVIAALLTLVMVLGGCTLPNVPNELVMKKSAEDISKKMVDGNFSEVYDMFSEEMKAQISLDTLKAGYVGLVTPLGEYVGIDYAEVDYNGISALVRVGVKYEKGGIVVQCVYSEAGTVSGMMIRPDIRYEPITNDAFAEIPVKVGEHSVDGILTLPKNNTTKTVVILVQGSGSTDMNETIGAAGNAPFKDIAHGLANEGIATLRYNKRYFQFPERATAEITISDEVTDDVYSAIEMMKITELADFKNIYIAGHSLGGMLAPRIAADNADVDGFVSLAGTLRTLDRVIIDQNADVLNAMPDLTAEKRAEALAQITAEADKVTALTEAKPGETIMGIATSYWHSLNQIDGIGAMKNLDKPMLILQGEADFQVYFDRDYKLWQTTLADDKNATFRSYPNLNHLFMKSIGKTDATEYDVAANVDPQVINDIVTWVENVAQR